MFKKGIGIYMDDSKGKGNEAIAKELEIYIKQIKNKIQSSIERGLIDEAKLLIDEYEKIVKDDIELYSIKGVIAMLEDQMEKAQNIMLKGLNVDSNNFDLLFNLGYLYERQGRYIESYKFYRKSYVACINKNIIDQIKNKIKELEKIETVAKYIEEQSKQSKKASVITIVTWAYNAEKYIEQCAESVLNQSFSDFEWVILDNGSTDRTGEILNKYKLKDNRIRLFKNEKNSFIYDCPINNDFIKYNDTLKTEYMCTLDSDDFLHPDFLKDLYTIAKKYNADIAIGGTEMFSEENPDNRGKRNPPDFYFDGIEKIGDILPMVYGCFRPVWGKLIKVSISNKSRECFSRSYIKMKNGADTMLCLTHLKFSNSVVGINKVLHYYRVRKSSHYYSQINKNRYIDYKKIYIESQKLLSKWGKANDTNLSFICDVFYLSLRDCINVSINAINASLEERIEVITTMLSDDTVKNVMNKNGLLLNLLSEGIEALNKIVESHKK